MSRQALRWLRRLFWRTLGVRSPGGIIVDQQAQGSYEHLDPQAIEADAARREAQAREALVRVRQQYHDGTTPLTVARGKVDVMRRMFPREGETGGWERKSP